MAMGRRGRALAVAAFVAVGTVGGCAGGDRSAAVVDELMGLYAAEDYFELDARLDTLPALRGPRPLFLRAAVAHVFNRPARSNELLRELGDAVQTLPDSLVVEAKRLEYRNHFRLSEYAEALAVARALQALPADSSVLESTENEALALEALAGVAPQRVVRRADVALERVGRGQVPVTIGDSARAYIFDTGANLSVLLESEAEALGLPIREAGMEVGTSTGSTVLGDVTVVPRLRIGGIELTDVAFLVFPDEVLTFGPIRIPGIIGFPVLDALGEIEFRRDGTVRVPGEVPERGIRNLAMDFLTPMVEIEILGATGVCEFDTGANATSLHLPFYEANRSRVESVGRLDTIRTAGAGGERRIAAYVLEDVPLRLADTVAVLPEVDVYTEALSPDQPDDDCRLGLDALAGFDGYLINLRSMTFLPLE